MIPEVSLNCSCYTLFSYSTGFVTFVKDYGRTSIREVHTGKVNVSSTCYTPMCVKII